MRITIKRLMWAVGLEACLLRAALATAAYRGIPKSSGEAFGIWFALNSLCVLPGAIWYLRSLSKHEPLQTDATA